MVRRNADLLCNSHTLRREVLERFSKEHLGKEKEQLPSRKQRFGTQTAAVTGGIKRGKSGSQQWTSVLVSVGVYFARLADSAGPKTFRLFPAPAHVKAVIKGKSGPPPLNNSSPMPGSNEAARV